ncbi:hypothetical protein BDZ97DRAFT_1826240, partial [Flammula alnicola]
KRSKWTVVQLLFVTNRFLSHAALIYNAWAFTINANAMTQSVCFQNRSAQPKI